MNDNCKTTKINLQNNKISHILMSPTTNILYKYTTTKLIEKKLYRNEHF